MKVIGAKDKVNRENVNSSFKGKILSNFHCIVIYIL